MGPGLNTNLVESFFGRVRRSAMGIHHRVCGTYLELYVVSLAWHENARRQPFSHRLQFVLGAGQHHPVSRRFCGYSQGVYPVEALGLVATGLSIGITCPSVGIDWSARGPRSADASTSASDGPPVVWVFLVVQVPNPRDMRRVPVGLRPVDRFLLRAGGLQDVVSVILDDVVIDTRALRSLLWPRLNVDFRYDISSPLPSPPKRFTKHLVRTRIHTNVRAVRCYRQTPTCRAAFGGRDRTGDLPPPDIPRLLASVRNGADATMIW